MKKCFNVLIIFVFSITLSFAQIISEGFEDVNDLMNNGGWVTKNLSNPRGSGVWYQDIGSFTAHSGSALSTITADFTAIPNNQTGTISCWLFTPEINFGNNDSLSFWAISFKGGYYPDRLEVRLSTNGSSTNVGNDEFSVGDFSTLLYTINPNLEIQTFPEVWIYHAIKLAGKVNLGQSGRIAFRYYITDGGSRGYNGSTIGIDDFKYYSDAVISTQDFQDKPFVIFPNPASSHQHFSIHFSDDDIYNVELLNLNGQKLLQYNDQLLTSIISTNSLKTGVYLLKISNINQRKTFHQKIIIH